MDFPTQAPGIRPGGRSRSSWLLVVGLFGVVLAGFGFVINTWAGRGVGSELSATEMAAFHELVARGGEALEMASSAHGQHGSGDMEAVPLTPEESERLAAELEVAAAAVPNYDTIEKALAAGYAQVSPYVDGVGAHFTKWSLVDQPFDLQRPSQLLFEEIEHGKGPELVAFSYWLVSDGPPEGFTGHTDQWHRHSGLCFEEGILTTENNAHRADCPGDWVNGGDVWMLHAWIVPGMENRFGVFHSVNPRLCERYCE